MASEWSLRIPDFDQDQANDGSDETAAKTFFAEADRELKVGFAGSALYHLKEAWWMKYYDVNDLERKELKQRLIDAYRSLGKSTLGDVLSKYFAWV
jgi:hypothetical protein